MLILTSFLQGKLSLQVEDHVLQAYPVIKSLNTGKNLAKFLIPVS